MSTNTFRKQSFLRFNVGLDNDRLLAEYENIPADAWLNSYWGNVHCSVGMLLRGGNSGSAEDFYSKDVVDQPILDHLPYAGELISESGPFGRAEFAFIFRMEPNGVTMAHNDYMERWHNLYRIHIPIDTNPKAHLIVNGLSQHLALGYAWTFDNQARHGVVNGPKPRTHLILDVPHNDKLEVAWGKAKLLPGEIKKGHLEKIESDKKARVSYPGDAEIMCALTALRERGLDDTAIAEFLNAKKIPRRHYDSSKPRGAVAWCADDVAGFY